MNYSKGKFTSQGTWVWTCFDPCSKYLIGMEPSSRGMPAGKVFVDRMLAKIKDKFSPVYMTDGYTVYNRAFAAHFGEWRSGYTTPKGRISKRCRFFWSDGFNYGQVVKTRENLKLESVEYVTVSGSIPDGLFNTSGIERMNLTIRERMARLKRRCTTFSKSLDDLIGSSDLFRAIYNFCRPHMSLGIAGRKVTPAMAMGLTDKVWSIRELMTFPYRQNVR